MYCEDSGLISCNKPRPRWIYGPKKGGENIFLKLNQLHYHMWCVIVRHMWCVHLLFTSGWKFSIKSLQSSLAKWIPRTRHHFSWQRVSARCILRTLVPRSTPVGGRSLWKRHLVAGQRRSGKQWCRLCKNSKKKYAMTRPPLWSTIRQQRIVIRCCRTKPKLLLKRRGRSPKFCIVRRRMKAPKFRSNHQGISGILKRRPFWKIFFQSTLKTVLFRWMPWEKSPTTIRCSLYYHAWLSVTRSKL